MVREDHLNFTLTTTENEVNSRVCVTPKSRTVFLNRRAAARYRALTSNLPGRERFSWNLSF